MFLGLQLSPVYAIEKKIKNGQIEHLYFDYYKVFLYLN